MKLILKTWIAMLVGIAAASASDEYSYQLVCSSQAEFKKLLPETHPVYPEHLSTRNRFRAIFRDPIKHMSVFKTNQEVSEAIMACGEILSWEGYVAEGGCREDDGSKLDVRPAIDRCNEFFDFIEKRTQ